MTTEKKQFIYVLKLIQPLLNPENWTEKEESIVSSHFSRLVELRNGGQLILAGKTSGLDEKTFGIVILEVDSEDVAKSIMSNDPCVREGIMTAELFPYYVAVMRE